LVKTDDGEKYRDDLKKEKRNWVEERKQKREKLYGKERDPKGLKRVKTAQEITDQARDQEEVADLCKEWVKDKVWPVFYRRGRNKNPWHDNIRDTIFWM
jgi:hypothetical protein